MNILRSLEQISTEYSVFEEDQVLTHLQLNSVVRYLDDQTRITRVNLLGVGIACGLRAFVQTDSVQVTKGVGVTTDGDLLYFSRDTRFDRFKFYDASQPKYDPFYQGDTMFPVYELVAGEVADERAMPLSQFNAQTGKALGSMMAVLLMESYEKDRDICSSTDCDNLGKDCRNTLRLLLADKGSAGSLQKSISTPHAAFGKLNDVVIGRIPISSAIQSLDQLVQSYRAQCSESHEKLVAELLRIYPACSGFLSGVFSSDPSAGWVEKLNAIRAAFNANASGIQYYFDFLKDLAETFNEFRNLLFGDTCWCCPATEAFPKHLMLGNLVPSANPDENRTAFYPSPALGRAGNQLKHAQFLALKLNTLILTFQLPAIAGTPIRITPSLSEDQPLEERAIPFYYQVNGAFPIHQNWNYRLHARGMDACNYSYNALAYGAQGGAAKPLTSQIGRFPFFRIEGHLGQELTATLSRLRSEIQNNNLPFAVRSVLLATDKGKLIRPGNTYTDIHRLHYLLRQDVSQQLDEVKQFSGKFKQQVEDAVAANTIANSPEDYDGPDIKAFVAGKHEAVVENADKASSKLKKRYAEFKKDNSWKADLNVTLKTAGEYKYNLSKVTKTEFNTPFDTLIGSTHLQWLDWLDEIIKRKEAKEDENLLFATFISLYPGLEHCAGVNRGGTFVLVYDGDGRVVADFMLPYFCCEEVEDGDEEPTLPKPGIKPGWIVDNGLKILPSRDRFIKDKITQFKSELEPAWESKFTAQKDTYLKVFQDSFSMIGNIFTKAEKGNAVITKGSIYTDRELEGKVLQIGEKQQVVEYFKTKATQPGLPADRKKTYEDGAKEAEMDLANSISDTAKYIDSSGKDVSAGSEGLAAIAEMNKGLNSIKDAQAINAVNTSFERLRVSSSNASFKSTLGTMIRR